MPDDLTKRSKQDALRINVNEDHELHYWTKALGVSADELKAAVKAVGVMAKDVRKHFGQE